MDFSIHEHLSHLRQSALSVLREAAQVSLKLYTIMIPVLIGVKILVELGWISYLAMPLRPLMDLVGLPPEMGLVWATALVNNIYSGIIVYLSLTDTIHLSVAQISVLSAMILVAHALPVEVRIARESGCRFPFQAAVRLVGAFLLGWILHGIYSLGGWLQGPSRVLWQGQPEPDPALSAWIVDQVINLALIFGIILGLIALMRFLSWIKVIDLVVRLLGPLLRFLGIGREAASLTMVGMTMGLTYGGGLIIHEARSGRVPPRDVFAAVTLMGLSHSLIEDTLLLLALGAHLSAILWGRLIFALLATALLIRLLPFISSKTVHRHLYLQDTAGQ